MTQSPTAKPTIEAGLMPTFGQGLRWLYAIIFVIAVLEYAIVCGTGITQDRIETFISIALASAGIITYFLRAHKRALMILWALLMFAVSRFLIWRLLVSLNLSGPTDALVALLLYSFDCYFACLLVVETFLVMPYIIEDRPAPLPVSRSRDPIVDIFISTLTEPVDLVRRTTAGALSINYANKRIYILDDGCREEMRALAESMGCHYIERRSRKGAKAGNLNNAISQTEGEFILTLDADHVPASTILDYTIGHLLDDQSIWAAQVSQECINVSGLDKNLKLVEKLPHEQTLFFALTMPAMSRVGGAFWVGSGAVIRRSALERIGGVDERTLTEDFHTTLRLSQLGYRVLYLPINQVLCLQPESLRADAIQRRRWFRGAVQTMFLDNPLLVKNLAPWQRMCFVYALLNHFRFVPRLVFFILPLFFLLVDCSPLRVPLSSMCILFLPYYLLTLLILHSYYEKYNALFITEIHDVLRAPALLAECFTAVFAWRKSRFQVTPKGLANEDATFDLPAVVPHILLMCPCAIGIFTGSLWLMSGNEPLAAGFVLYWNIFNLILLLSAVCLALEHPYLPRHIGIRANLPATLKDPSTNNEYTGTIVHLSDRHIEFASDSPLTGIEASGSILKLNDIEGRPIELLLEKEVGKNKGTLILLLARRDFDEAHISDYRRFIEVGICRNKSWFMHQKDKPIASLPKSMYLLLSTPLRTLMNLP